MVHLPVSKQGTGTPCLGRLLETDMADMMGRPLVWSPCPPLPPSLASTPSAQPLSRKDTPRGEKSVAGTYHAAGDGARGIPSGVTP